MIPTKDRSCEGDALGHSASTEGLVSLDDPRVIRAAEEYWALLEAGRRPDRSTFLGQHPEIATALAQCLDGLEFVRSAAPHLHQPTTTADATGDFSLPPALGDYRMVREIGRGGMGVVYEAEQISLARPARRGQGPALRGCGRRQTAATFQNRSPGRGSSCTTRTSYRFTQSAANEASTITPCNSLRAKPWPP